MLTSLPTKEFGMSKWQAMFGHSAARIIAFLDGIAHRAPLEGDVVAFNGERWTTGPNDIGGGAGAAYFQFEQASPATAWIINHNLGRTPSVSVRTFGGVEIWPDVIHLNQNQTQISLSVAATGRAYLT